MRPRAVPYTSMELEGPQFFRSIAVPSSWSSIVRLSNGANDLDGRSTRVRWMVPSSEADAMLWLKSQISIFRILRPYWTPNNEKPE